MEAGGYTDSRWWSEEGWRFVQDLHVQGPRFWVGRSRYRSLLEEIPMPWSLPVELNNLEADAFCNWKSQQLGEQQILFELPEAIICSGYLLRSSFFACQRH